MLTGVLRGCVALRRVRRGPATAPDSTADQRPASRRWPSPAVTKLDAMNWPSRAAPLALATTAGAARCGVAAPHDDVVAGSAVEDVLPAAADQHVVARAAVQVSLPALPTRTSSPSPPLAMSCIAVPSPDASITSSPPRPLMTIRSFGVEAGDRHLGAEARHREHAVILGDRDDVVAVGPVDDDGVRLAVATAAAGRCRRDRSRRADVSSGHIVDRDGVGAA